MRLALFHTPGKVKALAQVSEDAFIPGSFREKAQLWRLRSGGQIVLWETARGPSAATARAAERSVKLRGSHTDVWSLCGLEGGLVAGAFGNCGYDVEGEEVVVDDAAVIFDLRVGKRLRVLTGHALNVNVLEEFPDRRALASAGNGGAIIVSDVQIGGEIWHAPRSHRCDVSFPHLCLSLMRGL